MMAARRGCGLHLVPIWRDRLCPYPVRCRHQQVPRRHISTGTRYLILNPNLSTERIPLVMLLSQDGWHLTALCSA